MLRRFLSALLVVATAVQPFAATAQQAPFYRHHYATIGTSNPGGPTTPTPGGNEPVRGEGDLAIYLPVQVRARLGVPFSLQLRAQNGEGAITWTSVGTALPQGLTFNATTGFLTGTPTRIESSSAARFAGVDATGKTGRSPSLVIDVQPVPTIAVAPSYSARTGEAFSLTPAASPVFGSQTWTLAGRLPLGLSLNTANGSINGTPRQQGNYPGLRLTVSDADGATGVSPEFAIDVTSSITISNLPNKIPTRLSRAMSEVRPTATGAAGPYSWSVSEEGTPLPAGLTVNPSTGAISGTTTVAGQVDGVALKVVDAGSGASTISHPVSFTVAAAPTVAVSPVYNFRQGLNASVQVRPQATNLLAGGYWSISRSIPGATFSYSSGSLTGPVGSLASYPGVTFSVVDLFDGGTATSAPTTINIVKALQLGAPTIPAARVNLPFTMPAPPVDGLLGSAQWTLAGNLPAGLSLNAETGAISGTPTTVGNIETAIQVRDSGDGATTISRFNINVRPENEDIPFTVASISASLPASTNEFFRFTPTASGAKGTVSWTLSGALPAWAQLDPTTGVIAGTPTATQVVSGLTYRATDSFDNSQAESSTFSIAVTSSAPVTISMPDTLSGRVAEELTTAVPNVTGGGGEQFFALASGRVPEGMAFDTVRGQFSGMPTVSGDLNGLSILVSDQAGKSALSNTFRFSIAPSDTSPAVSMASRTATTGQAFTATPSASNAFNPLTWAVDSGTLPDWATFNATTGTISGTPPLASVSGELSLIVTDRFGRSGRTAPFTISVVDAPIFSATMGTNLSGTQGSTFIATPAVVGAKGAVTWSVSAGALPPGVGLNATTGVIAGLPTTVGSFSGIVLSGQDSSGATTSTNAFTVAIGPSPLSMEGYPGELTAAYGVAYTSPAPVVRGAQGTLVWSLASGTLPSWATLDGATGRISGVPGVLGETAGLRLRVTDENGTNAQTSIFKLTVARNALAASMPSEVSFHVNSAIATPAPQVSGSIGTPSFALTSGELPAGLTLNAATGVISGSLSAPTSASNLVITVTDSFDQSTARTAAFTLAVLGDPLITVASQYPGARDENFSATPSVTNAITPQSWTLEAGTLPSWATLSASTGAITGRPTQIETISGITLRMTDAGGGVAVSSPFSIVISSGLSATSAKSLYTPRVGVAFETDLPKVFNAKGTISWSLESGTLPSWAALNASTGVISGTANAPSTEIVVLRLTDSLGGTATLAPLTLQTKNSAEIAVASKSVRVGAPLTLQPSATGAVTTMSWTIASGDLPSWAEINTLTGAITGVPTVTGSWTLALRVTESDGAISNSSNFTITATPGLSVANQAPSYGGRIERLFSMAPVTISGAVGNLVWSQAPQTSLVPGMSLNTATGALGGTPSAAGNHTTNLVVRDESDQATLNVSLTVQIAQKLTITAPGVVSLHIEEPFVTPAPAVTGQRGTLTWSLAGSDIPAWANLNSASGSITGTAPANLTSAGPLKLSVTDSADNEKSPEVDISFSVIGKLGVASLPTSFSARNGTPFTSARPTAVNAIGQAIWSWGQGSNPPAWVSLNPATGVLSGTPTEVHTTSGLTLIVTDVTGKIASSAPFTLTVFNQPSVAISTDTVKKRVGDAVAIVPTATGLAGTATWSIVYQSGSDPLPAGLSFDNATGRIVGTPTAVGTSFFMLRVTDGNDQSVADSPLVSLTIGPQFVISGLGNAFFARIGSFIDLGQPTISGQAGATVSYSLSLASGAMPSGLPLDASTGHIRGVAATALSPTVATLTATDSFDQAKATATFTLGVMGAPQITGVSDVTLRNDAPVEATALTPSGSNLFYANAGYWAINGNLPNGVSLNPANGRLLGTPTGYETATTLSGLTLTFTDTTDNQSATSAPFNITINSGMAVSTTEPSFTVRGGASHTTAAPTVVGLSGTPAWSISTVSGVARPYSINQANGAVTITPPSNASGTWVYALAVKDSKDNRSASTQVSANVLPATTIAYAANKTLPPGQAISLAPTVSNNLGALEFSLDSGTLPAGMTLDPSSGLISGSSASIGATTVKVKARDTDGYFATSANIRIAVTNAPDVFLGEVPAAKVSKAFALVPTSDIATVTWSLTGTLPAGLVFNSANGSITGTPTTAGTSGTFRINALNTATSLTGSSEDFTITVAPGNVISVAAAAEKWRKGLSSTTQLAVANAVGAVTWSIASGTLPPGVTMDASGKISGTPTSFGSFSPVIRLVDSEQASATLAHTLNVLVGPTLTYPAMIMRPGVNSSVSPTVQNLVGTPTYAISGTLPEGLSFSTTTGAISGTPATPTATPSVVIVRLTDSDGAVVEASLSLIVSENAFVVDAGGTSFTGTVGQPFRLAAVAYVQNQSVGQYASWSINGKLPQGLTFDFLSGVISGTPTALSVGTATFSVQASYNFQSASTPSVTITISDRVAPTAAFGSSSYTARRGAKISIQPTAQNTVGSIAWTVNSGALPLGLALNEGTGELVGVPTTNGTYQFALRVTDSSKFAATQTVTMLVQDGLSASVTEVSSNNRIGKVYLANAVASGNDGAVTWSVVQGPLPTGVTLGATTGYVTGTPSQAGNFLVKVRATDASGASKDVSFTISVAAGPEIAAIPSQTAVVGKPFSYTPAALSAVPTLIWELNGALPAGLTYSSATGTISGTPEAAGTVNDIRLIVRDGDGLTATSRAFSITVNADSTTFAASMPSIVNFKQGVAGSVAPVLIGAVGTSRTYSLQSLSGTNWTSATAASLPAGLSFSASTGSISGIPTVISIPVQAYRIVAVDIRTPSNATATTNQFTLAIEAWETVKIATAPKYDIQRGKEFSMQPAVSGNVGATTYALQVASSGNWVNATAAYLPAGISFNAANGSISGTTVVQTVPMTTFRILATDARPVSGYSSQFLLGITNWEPTTITLPSNLTLNRGETAEIVPTVQGLQGTVQSFSLQGLSGTNWVSITVPTPGMTFSAATGVISGAPTTANPSYSAYRLYLTENRNGQVSNAYTNQMIIKIKDWGAPSVTVDPAIQLARGVSGAITPTITGVSGTLGLVSMQAMSGANVVTATVPAGMTLNTATGVISGTPTGTTVPNSSYRYVMTETRQGVVTSFYSNFFSINITNWAMPEIAYAPRTDFVTNQAVLIEPDLANIEGSASFLLYYFNGSSYNLSDNTSYLPTGLVFNRATGRISGTPTMATYGTGMYFVAMTETRSVNGSNQTNSVNTGTFRIIGAATKPSVSLAYGSDNVIEVAANGSLDITPQLSGAGAVTGPYTLTFNPVPALTGGKQNHVSVLPTGVTFDSATGRFAASSIAPSAAGSWYGYKVCAPTASGTACVQEVAFRIADRPLVMIDMVPYVDGARRQALSVTPVVRNAVGAVTWTLQARINGDTGLSSGEQALSTMPPGLSFDASTGTIYGAPTAAGIFRGYRLLATDSQGSTYRGQTQEIFFRISDLEPFTIKTPAIFDVRVEESVELQAIPGGAFGAVTWNTSFSSSIGSTVFDGMGTYRQATLPTGLSYDRATGRIYGTPSATNAEGMYRGYGICGTDEAARSACSDEIIIRVATRPPLTVKAPSYVTVRQGEAVQIVPSIENSFGALTWGPALNSGSAPVLDGHNGDLVKSTLPPGLVYSPTTGAISGTISPTAQTGRWRGYRIYARDVRAVNTFTDEIIIEVVAAESLRVLAPFVTDVVRGTPVTIQASTMGAIGTVTFNAVLATGYASIQDSANGDFLKSVLPAGLIYDRTTGTISGTVAIGAAPGRYRGYKFIASDSRSANVYGDEVIINVQ